LELIKDYD
jgi:hypothetical protein